MKRTYQGLHGRNSAGGVKLPDYDRCRNLKYGPIFLSDLSYILIMTYIGASSTTNRKVPQSKKARPPSHQVFKEARPRTRIRRTIEEIELKQWSHPDDLDDIETIRVIRPYQEPPRRGMRNDRVWRLENGNVTSAHQRHQASGVELAKFCSKKLPVIPSSSYAQRVQTNTRGLLARHTNLVPNESYFITLNLGVLFADQLAHAENYRRSVQRLFNDLHEVFVDEEPDFIHLNGYIEVASNCFDPHSNHRSEFVKDYLDERIPEHHEEVFVVHAHILCTAFDERGAWPQDRWAELLRRHFHHRKQVDVRAVGLRKLGGQNVAEQSQNCIEYQSKSYSTRHASDTLEAANYFMRCALPNMGGFEGVLINHRPYITKQGGKFLHRRDNFLTNKLPPWFEGLDDDLTNFLCTRKMSRYRQNNDPRAKAAQVNRFHRIHGKLSSLKGVSRSILKVRTLKQKKVISPTPKCYYDFVEPMRSELGETSLYISSIMLIIYMTLIFMMQILEYFP